MKEILYIYLAGNIKKGKEDEHEPMWGEADMALLQAHTQAHAFERTLVFLNPASRSDDLSDQKSVFGRDLFQVYSSHLVLVDARGKRGLGVGAEMMFAKMNHIPVVSWLPHESHYHRSKIHFLGQEVNSWIHPFVYSLSDYLAPSLEAAAQWIQQELLTKESLPKGPGAIRDSINHYLTTQLQSDCGMRELVKTEPYFAERIAKLNAENLSYF